MQTSKKSKKQRRRTPSDPKNAAKQSIARRKSNIWGTPSATSLGSGSGSVKKGDFSALDPLIDTQVWLSKKKSGRNELMPTLKWTFGMGFPNPNHPGWSRWSLYNFSRFLLVELNSMPAAPFAWLSTPAAWESINKQQTLLRTIRTATGCD